MFAGAPKSNHSAMIYAAKRNDYDRVKILFKYGYRLEQKDNITDPLKKIELFKVRFLCVEFEAYYAAKMVIKPKFISSGFQIDFWLQRNVKNI